MPDEMSALLDAFAELRRTWDELVGLQPDIISAGGPLSDEDLALLNERVSAHLVTAVALERSDRNHASREGWGLEGHKPRTTSLTGWRSVCRAIS